MRIAFSALGLVALLLFVCAWAAYDNRSGQLSLVALYPFAHYLSQIGNILTAQISTVIEGSLIVLATLLVVTMAVTWRRVLSVNRYLIVFFFAVAAQYLFILGTPSMAVPVEFFALVIGYFYIKNESEPLQQAEHPRFECNDFVLLFGITCLALFYRVYALNMITRSFDGELAPYYVGATNLYGIFQANAGIHGPWAPLGLLFYLPPFLAYHLFGVSLLSVRLSSVFTSVLTIWLLYLFVRIAWSRFAAGIAALFLALDNLQIGWGRTDIHPHGSTTWPSLIVAMLTLRAVRSGRTRDWWLLVPFMGLTWHQYPSGQLGFLIPLIVVAVMILKREYQPKKALTVVAILVCGIVVWGVGSIVAQMVVEPDFTLQDYVAHLGPRFFYNTLEVERSFTDKIIDLLLRASTHTVDLIQGIFFKAPYLFHQDIVLSLGEMPVRTISWIIVVLGVPALVLVNDKPVRRIFIALLVAGMIPAILSDHAYPKRASTIYPVLCALGGIGAAILWQQLQKIEVKWLKGAWLSLSALGLIAWSSVECRQWFGGQRLAYAVPYDLIIAERIKLEMEPSSITAFISKQHYFDGKMSLLLFNKMQSLVGKSVIFGYLPVDIEADQSPEVVWNKRFLDLEYLKDELIQRTILYKWTELREPQLVQNIKKQACHKLNLWIQLEGRGDEVLKRALETWPDAHVERYKNPNTSDESFALVIVENPEERGQTRTSVGQ